MQHPAHYRPREGAKGRPPVRGGCKAWTPEELRLIENLRSRKARNGTPDPMPYEEIARHLPGRTARACVQIAYVAKLPIVRPAGRRA